MMTTKYQQALLEKIKKIEAPDILALLKDGAVQRESRINITQGAAAREAAGQFTGEVRKLYEKARSLSS